MPAKSTAIHVRVSSSLFERLKAQAKRTRRPLASLAALVLDDHVEPLGGLHPPAMAAHHDPAQPVGFIPTTSGDLLALIEAALAERGVVDIDGQKKVALAYVHQLFDASRQDRSRATNLSAWPKTLKKLVSSGTIRRDMRSVWLPDQHV